MPETASNSSGATDSTAYGHIFLRNFGIEEFGIGAWEKPQERRFRTPIINEKWVSMFRTASPTTGLSKEPSTILQEGSTTEADTIEQNEIQVKNVIARIRQGTTLLIRDNLAKRLYELFEDSKEEEPDGIGIVNTSVLGLQRFFQLYSNLKEPALSLTPQGNIYASWRVGNDRVFSIHFISSNLVNFVIIFQDINHLSHSVRLSGTAPIEEIIRKVEPWGVLKWAADER